VRAASRLFSTHGVDLDTSVEAAGKSACATKNVENGPKLTLMGRTRWSASPYLLLILAIVSLGLYGYTYIERVVYQAYESRLFDRAAASRASVTGSNPETKPTGGVVQAARKSMPAPEPAFPISVIGRLSVPRLQFSAMVREGVDPRTLRVAVGHIPSTALPGQPGNVGLAGHRDTFFRRLKDLRPRDEIQFSTPRGNFKYQVESLTVVDPNNVEVLAPSRENVLTMVTCYPFSYIGSAPKRFVVRAKQVLTERAPNAVGLEIR
jgi:sortase A